INDYRRRMKQRTIFDGSGNDYIIDGKQATVANVAESNLRIKEVKTAINQLPEIFRTPFTLYVEGYRYLEIADLLHEPLGTIKSRIHFARKLLKEQIDRG
ncbi:MAG TPA: RNA polymerase sigma factor, partial [Chitinophagaceae bacterium]|nr:RNA polymerase sigma factor [Chitinophagaceae bacterium]